MTLNPANDHASITPFPPHIERWQITWMLMKLAPSTRFALTKKARIVFFLSISTPATRRPGAWIVVVVVGSQFWRGPRPCPTSPRYRDRQLLVDGGRGGPNVFEDSLNVMMMVDGWWWWRWDNWGLQSVGWGGCDGSFFSLVKAGLDVLQNRRIRLSQFRGRSQLQSKKKKTSGQWDEKHKSNKKNKISLLESHKSIRGYTQNYEVTGRLR